MKRNLLGLAAVLALALGLMVPAQAASEYGLIYDETEVLYSEELETLGREVLPAFVAAYDVDLRVDVLTGLGDFTELSEAAKSIYTEYGYGGSDGSGVSLSLLVHTDASGVALDDWFLYFRGTDSGWTEQGSQSISNEVHVLLSQDAWAGDLNQDIASLTGAVACVVRDLEGYLSGGSLPVEAGGETVQGALSDYVTDEAGLLTERDEQNLERQAQSISEEYGVGVYIAAVEDYRDYSGGDVRDAAEELYFGSSLGLGEDQDGILLLLSMEDRDYNIMVYGDRAKYAFNQAGREYLDDFFVDEFSSDDWCGGFTEYLTWSAEYLETAENGEPYSEDHVPMTDSQRTTAILIRVAIILLVPLVAAGIYILILTARMKSVAEAVEASAYVSGRLQLSRDFDQFSHTTETRRKIEKDTSSSHDSSSGASHTSGKF